MPDINDTALIPTMTSDTSPSGKCSSNSVYGAYSAYKAFDNDDSTYWNSQANASKPYIQYEFGSSCIARRFYIKANNSYRITGKVQASNDGSNFVDLSNIETIMGEHDILLRNNERYKYYRFQMLSSEHVSSAYAINEIQYYGIK